MPSRFHSYHYVVGYILVLERITLIRKAHLLTELVIAFIGITAIIISGIRSNIIIRISQTVGFQLCRLLTLSCENLQQLTTFAVVFCLDLKIAQVSVFVHQLFELCLAGLDRRLQFLDLLLVLLDLFKITTSFSIIRT